MKIFLKSIHFFLENHYKMIPDKKVTQSLVWIGDSHDKQNQISDKKA
jgi:hypothetical protein